MSTEAYGTRRKEKMEKREALKHYLADIGVHSYPGNRMLSLAFPGSAV